MPKLHKEVHRRKELDDPVKENKAKRVLKEFAELLQACWALSPRWTILFWLFIGISAYDQVRIFPRGYGTFYKLWALVQQFLKLF